MIAYEGNEPFVFISYAHADKDLVLPIIEGLQDRGFRVWYDEGIEVGNEWPDFIAEHIESCCGMVAFVSRNFGESNNCREELSFAKELEKTVLVIYLEDRKKLRSGVRMRLSTLHYMNLGDYADQRRFLDELAKAKALKPCLGVVAAHAKSDTPASVKHDAPKRANTIMSAPAKPAKSSAEELYKQADIHYSKREFKEAVGLYSKAAEMNYAPAQYSLGFCRSFGYGMPASREEAVKWYRKAAGQGYAPAQFRLGECFLLGRGVPINNEEAVEWYRKAADQGQEEAEYWLGYCYEMGYGVKKDKTEARKFYQRAADQGFRPAVQKLKTL